MKFVQRAYAHVLFKEKLSEVHGESFEDFFHALMRAVSPDFVAVRTHGNIGDQGSDGFTLHDGKIYACYSSQTGSVADIRTKFRSDLAKALEKRKGQFTTFVFVLNDARGAVHPEVATLLTTAAKTHPTLKFEVLDPVGLWQRFVRLDLVSAETLLGCEIPITDLVYGIGLEDLTPLLEHLKQHRVPANAMISLAEVSEQKLHYNGIDGELLEYLVRGLRSSHLVDLYYGGISQIAEHDEVAARFKAYYGEFRAQTSDPEVILLELLEFILGNGMPLPRQLSAAWVVLAHFFERCDIFEAPPAGWVSSTMAGGSA
ncbi:ABC-three component system protein [Kitasatospora sp. NPDC050463]|uniref:ABC-three component system protein n=1 Tax=Kitasatospora sp. NPDC050463 TaxID=3155786 RepID=UPI0033C6F440